MRLLRAFIAYEVQTQLRSLRFRLVSVAYIVSGLAPAVIWRVIAHQLPYEVRSGHYAADILALQPLLTTIMAAVLAVDAITREHEEGSFLVTALTPISSAGYFVRRWLAVVAVALPVTIMPLLIGAAIAGQAQRKWPLFEPFAWGWLLQVLPVLLVASALFMAVGTITGRTILGIVAVALIFTIGLELVNSALARKHRHIGGAEQFFFADILLELRRPKWSGGRSPNNPSEAGYRRGVEIDAFLSRVPFAAGVTFLLFAVAPAFLRRARADVRPWRIRTDHPMRTFLRMLNRIREDFTPDPAVRSWADRAFFVIFFLLGAASIWYLFHRQTHFERLAAAQFEAESAIDPRPMSPSLVPESIQVDAAVDRSIDARITLIMRNDGARPDGHLAFELNPAITIASISASSRRARLTRAWDRVGVSVDPPIAPGESCQIELRMRGTPGTYQFALEGGHQSFGNKYRRFQRAREPGELSDLSQSLFLPMVDETGMVLRGSDLLPSPRYSPWIVEERQSFSLAQEPWSRFQPESRLPATIIRARLNTPGLTVADSCAGLGGGGLESRCTMPIAEYTVAAARLTTMPLTSGATFAHLPLHAVSARRHAESIRESIRVAERAWPGLDVSGRVVFLERPSRRGEVYYGHHPLAAVEQIESSGKLHLLPELMIVHRQSLSADAFAAGIVTNTLKRKRRIVPEQQHLVEVTMIIVARSRVTRKSSKATVAGPDPPRGRLLEQVSWQRVDKVFAEIEHRVGADALVAGINDFLAAGPDAGSAKELVDAIARRGGVSLDRLYSDYFENDALPKLTLADVAFRRLGATWEVTGKVQNVDTGESFCPIVLRTQFDSIRKVVRVDSHESVTFTFITSHLPRAVQLDPEGSCYRAQIGAKDMVLYEGDT